MTATLLTDLRAAVHKEIDAVLPDLKDCREIEGRFDLEELKRASLRAPGVLVSLMGVKKSGELAGDASTFAASMAAFIVTKDLLGVARDVAAMNIGTRLLDLVDCNLWNMDALGEPENIRLESLITGKSRDVKASLWAVSWDQPFTFFEPETGPLGAALYVAHAPDGISADEADFVQIGGE